MTVQQLITYYQSLHHQYELDQARFDATALQGDKPGDKGKQYVIGATIGCNTPVVVKLCDNSAEKVPDICEREVVAGLFGRYLGVSIAESTTQRIPDYLIHKQGPTGVDQRNPIKDKCVVMKRYTPLCMQIEDCSDDDLLSLLAFGYWIGDEDRGDGDVMYDIDTGKAVYIDNGLCGPSLLNNWHTNRSAHPIDATLCQKLRMCIPTKPDKTPFVEKVFEKLNKSTGGEFQIPSVIPRILQLSCDEIEKIAGIALNGSESRFRWYVSQLHLRASTIEKDFRGWFDNVQNVIDPSGNRGGITLV